MGAIKFRMKRLLAAIAAVFLLSACSAAPAQSGGVAATTGPVAQFARAIAAGTEVEVSQVITDSVSCLHDYSLSVRQMETVEKSRAVLISGAGLEDFMSDALAAAGTTVDCSSGIALRQLEGEDDPHIWLDPARAAQMAENLCAGLTALYPQHEQTFRANTDQLKERLAELEAYGREALSGLQCRKLITFHDGFGYLAEAFDLEILAAVEEEAGSEASAADLTEIIALVRENRLPAVFVEANGSVGAASVIRAETGVSVGVLDMAMGGSDYFEAMKANIDTLKEALQ